MPATGSGSVSLGAYGSVPDALRTAISRRNCLPIVLAHFLAAGCAAVIIWQTVDLGRNALLTWACWTDFYPLIWVCLAVAHHLVSVLSLRLSVRISIPRSGTPRAGDPVSRSGLKVWSLAQGNQEIEISRKTLLRCSKAAADLLNNLNFLYGTAIFSSLTLVSGQRAIRALIVYGTFATFSLGMGVWVLGALDVSD